MKLLYKLHYRMYLDSLAWERTKDRRKKAYCEDCGAKSSLELHHLDYTGTPRPAWWKLLFWPVRYLFYIRPDMKSRVRTVCDNCHEFTHERTRK